MSTDPLDGRWPQSIASAEMKICGVKLVAHILDNGQRVFEVVGVHDLMTAWLNGANMSEKESDDLARFMQP